MPLYIIMPNARVHVIYDAFFQPRPNVFVACYRSFDASDIINWQSTGPFVRLWGERRVLRMGHRARRSRTVVLSNVILRVTTSAHQQMQPAQRWNKWRRNCQTVYHFRSRPSQKGVWSRANGISSFVKRMALAGEISTRSRRAYLHKRLLEEQIEPIGQVFDQRVGETTALIHHARAIAIKIVSLWKH